MNLKKSGLGTVIMGVWLSANALASDLSPCQRDFPISSDIPVSTLCDSNGVLRQADVRLKPSSGPIFLHERYLFRQDGSISVNELFSADGQSVGRWIYTPLGGGRFERFKESDFSQPDKDVWRTREFGLLDESTFRLHEDGLEHYEWTGSKWDLKVRDQLGPRALSSVGRIKAREIFEDGELAYRYRFEGTSRDGLVLSLIEAEGLKRKEQGKFDQFAFQSKSEVEELIARARSYGADRKKPIALIDSGLDLSNDDLLKRAWLNPREQMNAADNDGDGFKSNFFGYMWDSARKLDSGVVVGAPRLDHSPRGRYPLCHGTHVGDLLSRGLTQYGVMAFGGDYPKAPYIARISKALKFHQVRFANMSFDLGSPMEDDQGPMSLPLESKIEINNLLQNNPQTLFFIAAGNDGALNLDENERWPATLPNENKVVVAALDTASIEENDLWKYQLADFSNIGQKKVDIATPGTDVLAWNIARHRIPLSGTSMASPIAANIAAKLAEANEQLTNLQIKEIMMKTVYIHKLKSSFPIRSGGIAIERRALRAAMLMKSNPGWTAQQASLKAREEIRLARELEDADVEALKAFWSSRGL